MEIKAHLNNLRISPRKTRLVANLVKGRKVDNALTLLKFLNKKAAKPMSELIKSAVANATHNFKLKESDLFIKSIMVNQGIVLKRWLPRAQGRATQMLNKHSKVIIILDDGSGKVKEGVKPKAKTTSATAKPKELEVKDQNVPLETELPQNAEHEHGKEIVDPRMEGKHRHGQNADKREMKQAGGVKRKLFNRKSG